MPIIRGRALVNGRFYRICPLLLSLILPVIVGWRVELLGLYAGLLILSFDLPQQGRLRSVAGVAAALAAAFTATVAGFRIDFLTNPAGGYLYLHALSIPFTVLWIFVILRLREGLRSAVPRPAVQLAIDLVLVVNALLLILISPQTRGEPVARALPFVLLGIVAIGLIIALRGGRLAVVHRTIAFGLAIYGISGVMKGPVSLSLLAPLALIGLPMMTVSHALLAPWIRAVRPWPVPRWFAARGMTDGAFILSALALASAFALGIVATAHLSWKFGLPALLIVPVLVAINLAHPLVSDRLARWKVEVRAGRTYLFGVGFHNLTLAAACDRVEGMIHASGRAHMVVTPNSLSLFRAGRDRTLRHIYRAANLVIPDGIGVVWASRFLGLPLVERVTGIDLAAELLARASREGYRVFLLGGKEGVAEQAAARLQERFPGLSIVGTEHGYFVDDTGPLAALAAANPQILLVGMGVPRQERWMAKHAGRAGIPVMIGVGGALDIFAGSSIRASNRWQRLGLEWLYRILHQPRRSGAVWTILRFIVQVIAARGATVLQKLTLLPPEEF